MLRNSNANDRISFALDLLPEYIGFKTQGNSQLNPYGLEAVRPRAESVKVRNLIRNLCLGSSIKVWPDGNAGAAEKALSYLGEMLGEEQFLKMYMSRC